MDARFIHIAENTAAARVNDRDAGVDVMPVSGKAAQHLLRSFRRMRLVERAVRKNERICRDDD